MYTLKECSKLGFAVCVLLAGIIFVLEGCIGTRVVVISGELPCVMTETSFSFMPEYDMFEETVIDCSEFKDGGGEYETEE